MDKIHIRNLRLRTLVGINEWEQRKRQDVVLDITLHLDLQAAATSDGIEDTVDYKTVKDQLVELVEAGSWRLLEALAGEVAELCLEPGPVQAVDVTVDKPHALRFADSVAVQLHRP